MLCRFASGGIVAAALFLPLLIVGRPAFADEEEDSAPPVWTLTATVTSPTGDVTGHWVTPVGQNGYPSSPGENVTFAAKYTAKATGSANKSFFAKLSWTLEQGTRSADQTYTFVAQGGRGSRSSDDPNGNPPQYDKDGNWELGEQTLTKVWFIAAPPAQATNAPKNVARAQIFAFDTDGSTISTQEEDHKDFTVSFPTGHP